MTLWTKDFKIITIGTVVSMLGNAMVGFALSLFILDYTQSTLYYAIYIFLYTLPQITAPIISGPLIDRFSRRKMIYSLDFFSSSMFLLLSVLIYFKIFSFGLFAVGVFFAGGVSSVYQVAYDSFFPMLVTEGNYSKAYSIASTLETLGYVMVPVSTAIYKEVGLVPLLVFSGAAFFIAAVFEMKISDVEKEAEYIVSEKEYSSQKYISDLKDGWRYVRSEKGLLAIVCYFFFSIMVNGVSQIIELPFFRANYNNGEYVFMSVMVFGVVGRGLGGFLHYKIKFPEKQKFNIAFIVYVIIALLGGTYLYFSTGVMRVSCLLIGILGVTSYNIRVSATQSHVPDSKKGRFNGLFLMTSVLGMLIGELIAGVLSEFVDGRLIVLGINILSLIAAFVFILGNRKHVSEIYNRHV